MVVQHRVTLTMKPRMFVHPKNIRTLAVGILRVLKRASHPPAWISWKQIELVAHPTYLPSAVAATLVGVNT